MLTRRRKEVLDFMKAYLKKNGYSPSLQEIQKKLKLASVSTAHFHVSKLQNEGYITKQHGKARSIEISRLENRIERIELYLPSIYIKNEKCHICKQIQDIFGRCPCVNKDAWGYF